MGDAYRNRCKILKYWCDIICKAAARHARETADLTSVKEIFEHLIEQKLSYPNRRIILESILNIGSMDMIEILVPFLKTSDDLDIQLKAFSIFDQITRLNITNNDTPETAKSIARAKEQIESILKQTVSQ